MSRYRLVLAVTTLAIGCMIAFPVAGAEPNAVRSTPQAAAKARNLPNVVLIVLDALRADRVYGERDGVTLMPYLSHFAGSCVRFTNAVAPATLTRPSMTAIYLSRPVETHQVYYGVDLLLDSQETMATFLKKAGYLTWVIQTNGNLVREKGFAQGFDHYDDYLNQTMAEPVTNRALEVLPSLTEPFFFYVHYMDSHPPWISPESYHTLMGYPPPGLDPAEQAITEDFIPYLNDHVDYRLGLIPVRHFTPLSPLGHEAMRRLYDAATRYMDDQLGRLLDALPPNTYLIIIADHGEQLWEHDELGHGTTMYNPVLHVPFFLKGPGLPPQTIDANICTIDILPTIAALLGLPARPAWQGRSLFAARDPQGPTFSFTPGTAPPHDVRIDMVKLGSTKLIFDRRSGQLELYDVAADPGETTNLASQRPEQVDRFKALLEAHRQQNIRARSQAQR